MFIYIACITTVTTLFLMETPSLITSAVVDTIAPDTAPPHDFKRLVRPASAPERPDTAQTRDISSLPE